MIASGAKQCKNCKVLLKTTKWEVFAGLSFIIIFMTLGIYLSRTVGVAVSIFPLLILGLVYHFIIEFLPLKIQSKHRL